jgi:hypothetical protein
MDKTTAFYSAQPKRTKASEGEQCQEGKWYKNRTMVHLCCNADSSENLHRLMIGKLEKSHCLKAFEALSLQLKIF